MKTFVLGLFAAAGLFLIPSLASARWEYRTSYRWDPHCGRYITVSERYWVPDHHHHHHHHGYSPYDRRPYQDTYRYRDLDGYRPYPGYLDRYGR